MQTFSTKAQMYDSIDKNTTENILFSHDIVINTGRKKLDFVL